MNTETTLLHLVVINDDGVGNDDGYCPGRYELRFNDDFTAFRVVDGVTAEAE